MNASRLPPLQPEHMSPQQREIYEDILSGPRGSISGPFLAWLASPDFADRAQKLGQLIRYRTSLTPRLSELAILVTARYWRSQLEWHIHAEEARKAGLPEPVIEAIRQGQTPDFEAEDERIVYAFADSLHKQKTVAAAAFDAARDLLGQVGVTELVGICGYYTMVSMTLNVFQVPLPDGEDAPLPALPSKS